MLAETLPASVQPPGLQVAQQHCPETMEAPWQDQERRHAPSIPDWGLGGPGRNINNLRHADDTTLMAESEEDLKSLSMKVKQESECWLKAQHSENEDHGTWSHHFMANRWGNSGKSG